MKPDRRYIRERPGDDRIEPVLMLCVGSFTTFDVVRGRQAPALRARRQDRCRHTTHTAHGYLDSRPQRRSVFNAAMAASAPFFDHLAAAYRFPQTALVMDVGGGSGAMLAAILTAHPDLRGTVVDKSMCR